MSQPDELRAARQASKEELGETLTVRRLGLNEQLIGLIATLNCRPSQLTPTQKTAY